MTGHEPVRIHNHKAYEDLCARPEFACAKDGKPSVDVHKVDAILNVLSEITVYTLRLSYLYSNTAMTAREASDFLSEHGFGPDRTGTDPL